MRQGRRRLAKAGWNERLKLAATSLNALGLAVFGFGVLGPGFSGRGVSGVQIAGCFAMLLVLHLFAQWLLGKLED